MSRYFCKFFLLLIFSLLTFCNCAGSRSNVPATVRVKGSDTMLLLNRMWAGEFMQTHPGISIQVEGGGTATGVQALIEGRADICAASRPLHAEEAGALAQRYRTVGFSFLVAKDALSIFLHPQNPVKDLTLKQVKEIFTGKITNWAAVGGVDREILALIRPHDSGTYLYFKEHILEGAAYTASAQIVPTTADIAAIIARTPNAIGYGGIAYGADVIHARINGIPATAETVRYNLYPYTRYLYLYTVNKPAGEVKEYVDWILSPEGQRVVQSAGYLPLWETFE